jgi:Signal peptidase (SPase) II
VERHDLLGDVWPPALASAVAFLFTLGVDLGSKAVAVSLQGSIRVVYDLRHVGDADRRALLSLVALLVVYVLSLLASWRGLGRLWGTWVGLGLLLGGIVGNGLSHSLWSRGTPDFIWAGGRWVWNVADFAIGIGLAGGVASVAVAALVAVWREHRARAAV